MATNPPIGLDKEKKTFTTPGGTIFNAKIPGGEVKADVIIEEETPPTTEETINLTPKPKIASKTDAVVMGDETTGGVEVTDTTSLLSGLDREGIISSINKGDDASKDIAKELKNRRDIEKITGQQDEILKNIGFSTITEPAEKIDSVFSNEVALDFADRVLGGDFEKIGLAPNQEFDDNRVSEVLKGEGLTDTQIKQVIDARDARLKEKRIKGEGATLLEDKEALLQEELARKTAIIEKNTEDRQKLLQRQRSLRGVGRSSATEEDMLDLQQQGQELIGAANRASELELSLFRAEQEGAEAETISAIRKSLSDANKDLQEKVLLQNTEQAKLVAQGKLENEAAFESLVNSLEIAGVDKEGIDKDATELLGFVSDKFGNPIKIDGKKVPYSGSVDDADAITGYVDDIKAGRLTRAQVPAAMRNKVIAALALGRDPNDILSATQIADSRQLSKEIFGNTTTQNVNAIQGLMSEGLSSTEIKRSLGEIGYSEDYAGALRNAMSSATIAGFTKDQKGAILDEFNRRLDEEDEASAREYLLNVAVESTGEAVKAKVEGRRDVISALTDIARDLQDYQDQGGDTGLLTGVTENFEQNVLGQTNDPKLAAIASKIAIAIQSYRQSRSGAAFSESEGKEYASVFPGIGKVGELNKAKIVALIDVFNKSSENFYSGKFGADSFNKVFPDGIMGTLYPGVQIPGQPQTINTFSGITDDMTDEEIIEQLRGAEEFQTQGGGSIQVTGDSSDEDLGRLLDGDFNKPDQTGSVKEIPTTGFTEQVNIARTGDNVAKDTNNPGNITADSIPAGQTKEQYGKTIGATGTYLSPNGREYFVFPSVDAGTSALKRDLTAKITGGSRVIKPTDTLSTFQRVYVGENLKDYLSVLREVTGANNNTQIKDIDPGLLTKAVMRAEGFTS